jgi:hypothetical protein
MEDLLLYFSNSDNLIREGMSRQAPMIDQKQQPQKGHKIDGSAKNVVSTTLNAGFSLIKITIMRTILILSIIYAVLHRGTHIAYMEYVYA